MSPPRGVAFSILRLRLALASRRWRRLLFLFVFGFRVVSFVIDLGLGDSRVLGTRVPQSSCTPQACTAPISFAGRRPIARQEPPVLLLESVEDGLEEVDLRIARPFHL